MFSQEQRDELLKVSLSKIICENTDITEVPPDAFIFGKYPSGYVSCNNLPAMNLEAWREEKSEGTWHSICTVGILALYHFQ